MHIKLLNSNEFDTYSNNHILGTYHQSSINALFMKEKGFDYDFIGLVNENDEIKAAALIVYKDINKNKKYAYAPNGFLIDYYDEEILTIFTKLLIKFYKRKKVAFIKINPEIAVATLDNKTNDMIYNRNIIIDNKLEKLGYKKLYNNKLFESLLPRYNAIIDLNKYNFNNLSKTVRNKIRKTHRRGLSIEKASIIDIDILFNFIKKKKNKPLEYYEKYIDIFDKENKIDIFLIKLNFEDALISAKELYEKELIKNEKYNKKLMEDYSERNMKLKMQSDNTLLMIKNDIIMATQGLKECKTKYIGGAMTIKHKKRVNIFISGFDNKYKRYNPNHFLHYKLCEYYKTNYDMLDLNGFTGSFNENNPYYGLNKFKLGFKPNVYEFIGEYDLVINKLSYNILDRNGSLMKEFNRKQKA